MAHLVVKNDAAGEGDPDADDYSWVKFLDLVLLVPT
jgi:hypothetical protein